MGIEKIKGVAADERADQEEYAAQAAAADSRKVSAVTHRLFFCGEERGCCRDRDSEATRDDSIWRLFCVDPQVCFRARREIDWCSA